MMTESDIAKLLFQEPDTARTATSIATGIALADSSGGRVRVQIDGTQVGGESGVMLDTTRSISAGDRVIITCYGRQKGRRAFVSGVLGESEGGGGDLENRVSTLESEVSDISGIVSGHTTSIASLIAQLDGLYLDIISSTDASEWTVGTWATQSCFMQCIVIHDGTNGIMIGSFGAASNSSTGTSVWPTLRLGTFTHWKIGSSSNEPYCPIKVVNNAWANCAAVVRLGSAGGLYWTFWTGASGNLPAGEKVTGDFCFPVTKR